MEFFSHIMTIEKPKEAEIKNFTKRELTSVEVLDYINAYIPKAKNKYSASRVSHWLTDGCQFGSVKTIHRGKKYVKGRKLWVLHDHLIGTYNICLWELCNINY